MYENHLKKWAIERAQFANAYFRAPNEVAWTPEDFLGSGDRAQRQKEDAMSKQRAMIANAALAKIKKGSPAPDFLPDLFTAEYKGMAA